MVAGLSCARLPGAHEGRGGRADPCAGQAAASAAATVPGTDLYALAETLKEAERLAEQLQEQVPEILHVVETVHGKL